MIAIDLGSNTIRFLEYDCKTKEKINEYSKVVKTADKLAQNKIINDDSVERVIEAIKEAQNIIDFKDKDIKAITTQAIRVAENKDEVIDKIYKSTGVLFEIISGDREASLTLKAVKSRLDKLQYHFKDFIVLDIGGGSSEITFCYQDEVLSKSFPIGIVTTAQTYDSLDLIRENLPKDMTEIKNFCDEVYAKHYPIKNFIATAGTPTTLASLKLNMTYQSYDGNRINGTEILFDELDFYLSFLLDLETDKREFLVGTGRYDLILAGILIYKEIFKILNVKSSIVVDDGLREGIAIDYCNKGK